MRKCHVLKYLKNDTLSECEKTRNKMNYRCQNSLKDSNMIHENMQQHSKRKQEISVFLKLDNIKEKNPFVSLEESTKNYHQEIISIAFCLQN